MPTITTEPGLIHNMALSVLDRFRRSKYPLGDLTGDFLRALSAFIILREADIDESNREAAASFDGEEFDPILPPTARWSQLVTLAPSEWQRTVEKIWDELRFLPDTKQTAVLRRIPACLEIRDLMSSEVLEPARRLVEDVPLETSQGRRELARAFEGLIEQYLRTEKYSGEFSTSVSLTNLMLDIARPRIGERVYDPCFGMGGLLAGAARRIVQNAESLPPSTWQDVQHGTIFGVELLPANYLISAARIILAGIRFPNLELGNTLERPLPRNRSAEGFDCIVAHLPFGIRESQPPEHFLIKSSSGETNFLQHILANLRLGGRAVVLVPEGVLFKHGPDEALRRMMLEEYHLDAVISLPSGALLPYAGVKTSILCISRREPAKEVLFLGQALWEKDLEKYQNRLSLVLELIHRRQGFANGSTQVRDHLEKATTKAFFNDAFDDFNPKLGQVTPSGDPERLREYVKAVDLIRAMPATDEPTEDSVVHRSLKALPERFGVRLAWLVPASQLASRHWELVAKETGEAALEEFLRKLDQRGDGLRRISLSDVGEVFTGVGYDRGGTVEVDYAKIDTAVDAIGLVPLVRVQDVGREKRDRSVTPVVRQPSMYLNEKGMERVQERHRLRVGDILLTCSGTVGNLGLVPESLAGAVAAKSLIVIRSTGTFTPLALLRLLQSAPYQEWFRGSASGSVIRHLSVKVVRQAPLLMLTLDQQQRLAQQLREGSDAEAVLQAFTALSGESLWISLLLNDPGVRALLEAGRGQGYTPDWWETLRTTVGKSSQWRGQERESSDRDPFRQKMLGWLEQAEGLLDAMELPAGMDRYGALQAWDKWALHELMGAKDSLQAENQGDDIAGRAAERFAGLAEVLLDAGDTECKRIAGSIRLEARVEQAEIFAGAAGELQLLISNKGIAPLRRLAARILSLDAEFRAPLLKAEEAMKWSVPVPPQPAGPLPFQIEWSGERIDGEAISSMLELSIEIRSLRAAANQDIFRTNPYIVGSPIDSAEMFFGRDDIIDQIRRSLRLEGPSTVILLEGNRRVGKTSILKRLQFPDQLPGWVPVYCQFQGISGEPTAQNLYRLVARELIQGVAERGSKHPPEALRGVASAKTPLERRARSQELANTIGVEHPFERFEELLQIVLEVARPHRILLMLDEFEKIHEGIEQHTLSPLVPENFRYLFHTYPELSGILSGSRRIKRLRQEYWNVLFGIGKPIWVRSLNPEAARQLVIKPVAGRLSYSEAAVERAMALCACQPFLLQSLASAVFETCATTRQSSVTLAIVEAAAQTLVQDNEHFHTIYRQEALTPRRRFLTCLINRLTPGPDRVTFDLLLDQSETFGVEYPSEAALKEDLEELQELELVRFDASSASYQIEIPLFSHWLDRLDFQAELGKAKSEE